MTLRHIKIFVTVFECCHMTRAAARLHMTQPSVSVAIQELENYYGQQLFERIGRRIAPTAAGREFYAYALHLTSLFDEMEKQMRNWDRLGTLRIGSSITIGTHILPGLVRRFQALRPEPKIEVRVNNSAQIERELLGNRIDLALIEIRPQDDELCAQPFLEDYMCAIVPPGHPLCAQESVSLAELSTWPFLMRDRGSAGRELLDNCFAIEQLKVEPLWESSSTQAVVSAVSEGLGVAVLPYLLVEKAVREAQVHMLALKQPLRREFYMVYHKNKYLSPNLEAFIRLCEELRA